MSLRDFIFSQQSADFDVAGQAESGTSQFSNTSRSELIDYSQLFSQPLQTPATYQDSEQQRQTSEKKSTDHASADDYITQIDANRKARRYRFHDEIPMYNIDRHHIPIYDESPEVRFRKKIKFEGHTLPFAPQCDSMVRFSNCTDDNSLYMRRDIVKLLFEQCYFAKDVDGALMALKTLSKIDAIALPELIKYLELLRLCRPHSTGQIDMNSVVEMLLQHAMPRRQTRHLERSRTTLLHMFIQALVAFDMLEPAEDVVHSRLTDQYLGGNFTLKAYDAALTMLRVVDLSHVLNETLQLNTFYIPTLSTIMQQPFFFFKAVKLLYFVSTDRALAELMSGNSSSAMCLNSRKVQCTQVLSDLRYSFENLLGSDSYLGGSSSSHQSQQPSAPNVHRYSFFSTALYVAFLVGVGDSVTADNFIQEARSVTSSKQLSDLHKLDVDKANQRVQAIFGLEATSAGTMLSSAPISVRHKYRLLVLYHILFRCKSYLPRPQLTPELELQQLLSNKRSVVYDNLPKSTDAIVEALKLIAAMLLHVEKSNKFEVFYLLQLLYELKVVGVDQFVPFLMNAIETTPQTNVEQAQAAGKLFKCQQGFQFCGIQYGAYQYMLFRSLCSALQEHTPVVQVTSLEQPLSDDSEISCYLSTRTKLQNFQEQPSVDSSSVSWNVQIVDADNSLLNVPGKLPAAMEFVELGLSTSAQPSSSHAQLETTATAAPALDDENSRASQRTSTVENVELPSNAIQTARTNQEHFDLLRYCRTHKSFWFREFLTVQDLGDFYDGLLEFEILDFLGDHQLLPTLAADNSTANGDVVLTEPRIPLHDVNADESMSMKLSSAWFQFRATKNASEVLPTVHANLQTNLQIFPDLLYVKLRAALDHKTEEVELDSTSSDDERQNEPKGDGLMNIHEEQQDAAAPTNLHADRSRGDWRSLHGHLLNRAPLLKRKKASAIERQAIIETIHTYFDLKMNDECVSVDNSDLLLMYYEDLVTPDVQSALIDDAEIDSFDWASVGSSSSSTSSTEPKSSSSVQLDDADEASVLRDDSSPMSQTRQRDPIVEPTTEAPLHIRNFVVQSTKIGFDRMDYYGRTKVYNGMAQPTSQHYLRESSKLLVLADSLLEILTYQVIICCKLFNQDALFVLRVIQILLLHALCVESSKKLAINCLQRLKRSNVNILRAFRLATMVACSSAGPRGHPKGSNPSCIILNQEHSTMYSGDTTLRYKVV